MVPAPLASSGSDNCRKSRQAEITQAEPTFASRFVSSATSAREQDCAKTATAPI
jgi:hypothetical protein